jgi:hypothetical protein
MSSTKSLIECLQDDVKHYNEELHREFSKQVKDPKKQKELMDKRYECLHQLHIEWVKEREEWEKKYEKERKEAEEERKEAEETLERIFSRYEKPDRPTVGCAPCL